MRKLMLGLVVAALLTIGVMPVVGAEEPADVKLTEEQKTEMAGLHKELFDQKKEIITKYVEYGVFTEEKGQKIISHIDKHYNKLEENGFVPKWDKKHHHHKE
ncbi:YckD family protein [Halalkalibacter okhensis]|uniref:Sporulation protein n=1 Tax=Halalkalibacter okhensis TaxID=333138 RepID=A0A0B0IIP0_9BACI|nr:YckD family protein [Halalkalibacter okhensis]KHF40742.1 hypothetical protein LQ50_08140 [Halalkalibacter okhensis]